MYEVNKCYGVNYAFMNYKIYILDNLVLKPGFH